MPNVKSTIDAVFEKVNSSFSKQSYKSPITACPMKDIVGKRWERAAKEIFPGKQSYQNCGLQSSRQIIEQARQICLAKDELTFMEDAIKSCSATKDRNHPDDSGGTNAEVRKCVLKEYGVDSEIKEASVETIDLALRARKGVIISADVEELWKNQGVGSQSGRHAVVITHGEYDKNGDLTAVFVNDTGINKRYRLTVDELEDALESGSGLVNITDNAIWPVD